MSPSSSTRVGQALKFLQQIGIPREQHNERSALTLLALADIKPRTPWKRATAPLRRITEMMDWMRDYYETRYAPNTRETIRRQTVHQFVQHGLLLENPDQPERPINSPNWCYQLRSQKGSVQEFIIFHSLRQQLASMTTPFSPPSNLRRLLR